jgi:hypothetical protein
MMPWSYGRPVRRRIHFGDDRLDRTRRYRSRHPLTLRDIGVRVVCEGFLAVELKHFWRQGYALCVAKASIQVDDNAHVGRAPFEPATALTLT